MFCTTFVMKRRLVIGCVAYGGMSAAGLAAAGGAPATLSLIAPASLPSTSRREEHRRVPRSLERYGAALGARGDAFAHTAKLVLRCTDAKVYVCAVGS
jgi:hypothetical protein